MDKAKPGWRDFVPETFFSKFHLVRPAHFRPSPIRLNFVLADFGGHLGRGRRNRVGKQGGILNGLCGFEGCATCWRRGGMQRRQQRSTMILNKITKPFTSALQKTNNIMSRSIALSVILLLFSCFANGFMAPKPVSKSVSASSSVVPNTCPPQFSSKPSQLLMSTEGGEEKTSNLPFWLDIGTKGGAVFFSLVLFILPIIGYNIVTGIFGVDEIEAGKYIGVGFTAAACFLWFATYIFRVATKDMTYAKQLKDYENAVIAKRLEELDEDEIQALVEEIDRDEF